MLAIVPWLPTSVLNMDLNETQWYKDLYYGVGDIGSLARDYDQNFVHPKLVNHYSSCSKPIWFSNRFILQKVQAVFLQSTKVIGHHCYFGPHPLLLCEEKQLGLSAKHSLLYSMQETKSYKFDSKLMWAFIFGWTISLSGYTDTPQVIRVIMLPAPDSLQ